MRTSSFARTAIGVIGAALVAAIATPATGQSPSRAPAIGKAMQVTPYAGYMMFGKLVEGPLGTSLTSAPARIYGAQIGLNLSPSLAVVGNVGFTSGDLRVGVPLLGGVDVGEREVLLADAGLQLTLPGPRTSGLAIVPFLQAGAGVIRNEMSLADMLSPRSTSFAGNVGAGADLVLTDGFALRFLVKDYISKFDVQEAAGFETSAAKVSHDWALTAGLRIEF
jgi:hypothetical protein